MVDNRISSYYLNFKRKYKNRISDVPSIDNVVDFYLANKDNVNFSDLEGGGYPFLVDLELEQNPPFGIFVDDYYYVDEEEFQKIFPKGYIKTPNFENRNFILFEGRKSAPYIYPDQCKLWVNTKLESCFEIALELAKFINKNHSKMSLDCEESKTCYKISTIYRRNDAITIYTNYMEVDSIISFLNNLKQEKPQLFETDRRPNPLIPKIDGFISFADVNHAFSAPGLIAEKLQQISGHEKEVDELPYEKQHAFVKSLIIKSILEKTNYAYYAIDSLLNTKNFCTTRLNNIPFNKLTTEEGEQQRAALQNQLAELETQLASSNGIQK